MKPAEGGTYVLICRVGQNIRIGVGKSGRIEFERGYYAYVGSALNGLEARIGRHLGNRKTKHWHIDYLLEHARSVAVIFNFSPVRAECKLAAAIGKTAVPVPGFGSSDCRCRSHLFSFARFKTLEQIASCGFSQVFGRPPSKFYVRSKARCISPGPGSFSAEPVHYRPDSPGG